MDNISSWFDKEAHKTFIGRLCIVLAYMFGATIVVAAFLLVPIIALIMLLLSPIEWMVRGKSDLFRIFNEIIEPRYKE